jgi:hypothetical protein
MRPAFATLVRERGAALIDLDQNQDLNVSIMSFLAVWIGTSGTGGAPCGWGGRTQASFELHRVRDVAESDAPLPRFVRIKTLATGAVAFYWDLTGYYRGLACPIPSDPLGTDYVNGGRADVLNALFDE